MTGSFDHPVMLFGIGVLIVILMIGVVLSIKAIKPDRTYETRRLYFAAVILSGIGLIFMMAMAMYYFQDVGPKPNGTGKEIFEACVQVLPPIVTLVLGFYFGRGQNEQPNAGGSGQAQTAGAGGAGTP